ncbi:MAG: hypothetical protein ACLFO2_04940 [Candidatus Woesearchaeota archaeon]
MELTRSRKAYFFSLTVLILLTLLAVYTSVHRPARYHDGADVEATRLVKAEELISAVEDDAATALRVASYRAFIALDEAVLRRDGYVDGFDDKFEELVTNGTLDGQEQPLLNATTLTDWENQTVIVAQHLHYTLNLTGHEIRAYHEGPWHVTVSLDTELQLTDERSDAQWELPLNVTARVPVRGLYDPLYTVGTDQRYFQRVTPAPQGAGAARLVHDRLYINSTRGPSYLQRLRGDLKPSEHGIESLVNATTLTGVGAEQEGSIIDWHYLDDQRPADCTITGLPSWAAINTTQPGRFGVTCP